MNKKFVFALATVLLMPACASVQAGLDKVLPKVEAAAGKGGVQLKVNGKALVDSTTLCLSADGKVAEVLNKIPVLGSFVVGAIGVCDAPAPAPEVL